jgi:hypothetical protein
MPPVASTKNHPKTRSRPSLKPPHCAPQPSSQTTSRSAGHSAPQVSGCVLKDSLVYDCHQFARQVLRGEATKHEQLTSMVTLLGVVRHRPAAAAPAVTLQSRAQTALTLLDRAQENQRRYTRQRFTIKGNLAGLAGIQLAGPAALRTLAHRFPRVATGYWQALGAGGAMLGIYGLYAGYTATHKNQRSLREANHLVDKEFQKKLIGRCGPPTSIAFTARYADLQPQRRQFLREELEALAVAAPVASKTLV